MNQGKNSAALKAGPFLREATALSPRLAKQASDCSASSVRIYSCRAPVDGGVSTTSATLEAQH